MPDAELLYLLSLFANAAANLIILAFVVPACARRVRPGLIVLCAAAVLGLFLSLAYWACGSLSIYMSGHPAIYSSLFLTDVVDSVLYALGVVLLIRELNATSPLPSSPEPGVDR